MGAEVLFLDRFEAQNLDPRFHGQQWRRVPAHSSSSGRAIAAFNPTAARSMFEVGLIRRTRYTVVDPRRLGEILAEVRRRGYAATHEELEEGISSVAAPILIGEGHDLRAIAAVSVAGPTARLQRGGIATIATHTREAADHISRQLRSAPAPMSTVEPHV
jgi:DNA-binding IclR family transcriptional regulator